jgi:hypothetical protein
VAGIGSAACTVRRMDIDKQDSCRVAAAVSSKVLSVSVLMLYPVE